MNVSKVSPMAFLGTMTTNLEQRYDKIIGDKPSLLKATQQLDKFVKKGLPGDAEVQISFTTETRPKIHVGKLETVPVDKDTPKSKIRIIVQPNRKIDPEAKGQQILQEPFSLNAFVDAIGDIKEGLTSLYS